MTAATTEIRPVGPGDLVETLGRRLGEPGRTGEIVAVLGEDDHPYYLVRWEDGRESTFHPGEGTRIRVNEFVFDSAD